MTRPTFVPTPQTTLKRRPERGTYERAAADRILDEAFVAHVGFTVDGQPIVIPMVFGRDGDRLFLHGSVASRLLRALDTGAPVCVTVTLVDGIVLAPSHFHHSVNYRSVVVVGTARRLGEPAEQRQALGCVVDHVIPGRADETRPANDAELRETMVLELAIETASVKTRTGGTVAPSDEDGTLPVWAGVVPLTVVAGPVVPDEQSPPTVDVPASVSPWTRLGSAAARSTSTSVRPYAVEPEWSLRAHVTDTSTASTGSRPGLARRGRFESTIGGCALTAWPDLGDSDQSPMATRETRRGRSRLSPAGRSRR